MNYTQLTREQRYQIYGLMKAGHNQSQIAALVGCHKSTIMRELRRNCGIHGYYPNQAQLLTRRRQRHSHGPRIPAQTWQQVELLLGQQWSPEQITGRLKLERQQSVSPERIYLYIYADKRCGGTLHCHLRSQKKQRKRYGAPANWNCRELKVYVNRVGFDQLGVERAAALNAVDTRLKLPADQVDAVIAAGRDSLRSNPTFRDFLRGMGGRPMPPPVVPEESTPVAAAPDGPASSYAAAR